MTPRAGLVLIVVGGLASAVVRGAQQPAATHLTIPVLANATKPADLDFQSGECEVEPSGLRMQCAFEQVFLTASPLNADTCLVTTNRYELRFDKQAEGRWISREGPEGACGIVDETTLRDEGGVRWTLENRKVVTTPRGAAACGQVDQAVETLSWQNVRRPLPCRFVQPGALSP